MQPKQNNLLFFVGSVALLIVAIGIIALLQGRATSTEGEDVRARAGATSNLEITGTVSSVDYDNSMFVISNAKFKNGEQSLGSWTVTPPTGFSLSSLSSGKSVVLSVRPETFDASSHTLSATEVKVQ